MAFHEKEYLQIDNHQEALRQPTVASIRQTYNKIVQEREALGESAQNVNLAILYAKGDDDLAVLKAAEDEEAPTISEAVLQGIIFRDALYSIGFPQLSEGVPTILNEERYMTETWFYNAIAGLQSKEGMIAYCTSRALREDMSVEEAKQRHDFSQMRLRKDAASFWRHQAFQHAR